MDSIGKTVKLFFGNVSPGRFRLSLTKGVLLLGQTVRYHKSPIILRINMGPNQRKPIIIDLRYFKLNS